MPRDRAKIIDDARQMRTDMERHKPAKSELDVKLGSGGLVDLEFAVHVLQLTTGKGLDPRLDVALEQLAAESLVPLNIVDAQNLLTRMLVMMRLVAPGDMKPTAETWNLVASACGAASWDDLLAEHDGARQSIAALWNGLE
jgi:glutamate-ammonia-ligase adenylyltransferase